MGAGKEDQNLGIRPFWGEIKKINSVKNSSEKISSDENFFFEGTTKNKKIAFYSGLYYFLPFVDDKEIDLSEGRVTFLSNNTPSNNILISGTWIVKQLLNPKVKQIISK